MQYVREAGSDPSFLLKALSEAAGELRRSFYGLRPRDLLKPGGDPDEGWSLLAIPWHMREVEKGVLGQFEAILRERGGPIPHVDFDDIPFREDYCEEDEEELLEEFYYLRRRSSYLLWDISASDWDGAGIHPYRGRMTVLQIVRETYQHDLEHLWQVRRMLDRLTSPAR